MKILSVCSLLSLLAGQTAFAADARPAKPEMKLDVPPYEVNSQVFDFPTGLRVVMQSDPSHSVVTVHTIVNHGSADDPPGKEETAHFCEHAWFRSKHGTLPSVMELLNEIGDIGGTVNASTRNDYTDYTTVAAAEYLPLLLKLESLRLTEPYIGITETEIDTEREVIRNEFRWRREELEYFRFDYLFDAVYPESHGYHGASSHTSIDNIALPDIKKFFDDYYTAENTTITVVGDFDANEAASLIFSNIDPKLLHPKLAAEHYVFAPKPGIQTPDQTNPDHFLRLAYDPDSDPKKPEMFKFSPRTTARVTSERPASPDAPSKEVVTRKAPIDNKRVMIGWSLPGGYRSDHWNLIVMGGIASQYIGNGLLNEIDQDRITEVWCTVLPEVVNSTMMCQADILDSAIDPLSVRDRMVDQLSQIWNPENFSGDTFQARLFNTNLSRSKMEIMQDLLLSLDVYADPYSGRATEIGESSHLTNSPTPQSDAMKQVMAIDPSSVSDIAFQYLKRDRAVTVVLEPMKDDEIDVGGDSSGYAGSAATTWESKPAATPDDLSNEQIAASYMKMDLSEMQDFKLDNGLRVVMIKHGEAPLLQASLLFRRDVTTEEPLMFDFVQEFTSGAGDDPLPIATYVNWFVFAGIPGLSGATVAGLPPQLTELPFSKPLVLSPDSLWGNGLRFEARAPGGNLEGALWLLRNQLETARPEVEGKNDFVKAQRDAVVSGWNSRAWHVTNNLSQFLYPNAPWRQQPTWEQAQATEAWTSANVTQFLSNTLQPANATLLIVGNIDPVKGKEIVTTHFGGWKPPAGTVPGKLKVPEMPTAPSKIMVYDDPKSTQTELSHMCRLNVTDPVDQRAAVGVLSSLLGQQTFNTLRVLEGLAYSPSASAGISSDGSATLSFGASVINTGVGRMVQFAKGAVDRVEKGEVPGDEIAVNKLRQARIDGLSAQSLQQVTDQLTEVVRTQTSWDWLNEHGQRLAAVDGDALKALIAGCNDHSITTLQGPKDVITPQLDELGYTYEVVEWRADGDELLWKYDPKAAKKKEKKKQKSDKKKAKEAAKKEKEGTAE